MGPYINCPRAIPTKKDESESATRLTVVSMEVAMAGNPGRYMSMENGTTAVKRPSMRMVRNLRWGVTGELNIWVKVGTMAVVKGLEFN